jgi:molecular chaperone Hsp33
MEKCYFFLPFFLSAAGNFEDTMFKEKSSSIMADKLIRATAAAGGIRVVGAITTQLTEEARGRHKLSYVATAALGRTMVAGLLFASSMKKAESRVNIRIKGKGPLQGILVDAGTDGTVRGYVGNPSIELPLTEKGKLDVGGAVGRRGYLYVVRDSGSGQPYNSTVELVSGEIGDDLAHYLVTSEQTPSALIVGVFVDASGVTAAGGLLIQVLPKAARDEDLVDLLQSRLSAVQGFTPMLQAGMTLPQMMEGILGDLGLEIFPEVQILRYQCGCTVDRMAEALKMLGKPELEEMLNSNRGAEVTCEFCADVYSLDEQQLRSLISGMPSG